MFQEKTEILVKKMIDLEKKLFDVNFIWNKKHALVTKSLQDI